MHVITYQQSRGGDPTVVTNYDAQEDTLRDLCADLARNGALSVTLHSLSGKGVIAPLAIWENEHGHVTAKLRVPTLPPIPPMQRVDDEIDMHVESPHALHDDDENVYDGFCVKCREHRDFHGEIVEMANGRRRAKGNCPVCGTGISRILANLPVSEDYETPDDEDEEEPNPDDNPDVPDLETPVVIHDLIREPSNRGTHLSCECGNWEKWVTRKTEKAGRAEWERHVEEATEEEGDEESEITVSVDAPEGTSVEAIAEAVADHAEEIADAATEAEQVAIPEFSDEDKAAVQKTTAALNKAAAGALREKAGKAAKKAQPRKSTSKVTDAEIESAKNMKVATCPQCSKKVPVMVRGGLDIFTVHPNAEKGLDRCPGSTTTVS